MYIYMYIQKKGGLLSGSLVVRSGKRDLRFQFQGAGVGNLEL